VCVCVVVVVIFPEREQREALRCFSISTIVLLVWLFRLPRHHDTYNPYHYTMRLEPETLARLDLPILDAYQTEPVLD
jgi:hypothetical protein